MHTDQGGWTPLSTWKSEGVIVRKDEVQDFKDPGCARDIVAGIGILVGLGVAIGTLFYGVTSWPW